jgi:tetratricopeptide (TPR) repeat protein
MSLKQLIVISLLAGICFPLYAQEENNQVRTGNKYYKSKKYTDAEVSYRKALQKNKLSFEANYNLGNSLFRQQKYTEALEQFQAAVPMESNSKEKLAAAYHNAGNALLMQKKVEESIEAYKKALKLNPADNDTRYNLAFAQHLLKNNQQEQKNQPQQQQNKEKQQQSQPQPQPDEAMSKEQAEQILQALMQDEQETMEKSKKQPKATRKGTEKDW